jgi:hypothetical protein
LFSTTKFFGFSIARKSFAPAPVRSGEFLAVALLRNGAAFQENLLRR